MFKVECVILNNLLFMKQQCSRSSSKHAFLTENNLIFVFDKINVYILLLILHITTKISNSFLTHFFF